MNSHSSKYSVLFSLFSAVAITMIAHCSPPPFSFKLTPSYVMDTFSGRDINGRTIGVCALLTKDGPVDEKQLPVSLFIDSLHGRRKDLTFKAVDSSHPVFFGTVSPEDRIRFFSMLYKGKMLASAKFDTVWSSVGYDYLLVFNLRHGMSISTFNKVLKKDLLIESELWDCSSFEVVWRASIEGATSKKDLSDRRFISAGVADIASALPALLPSYEKSDW